MAMRGDSNLWMGVTVSAIDGAFFLMLYYSILNYVVLYCVPIPIKTKDEWGWRPTIVHR